MVRKVEFYRRLQTDLRPLRTARATSLAPVQPVYDDAPGPTGIDPAGLSSIDNAAARIDSRPGQIDTRPNEIERA